MLGYVEAGGAILLPPIIQRSFAPTCSVVEILVDVPW